jgi:hypothetical protein
MSLPFNPDTSVQISGENTFNSSTDKTNLDVWTKDGINLFNTSLGSVGIGTTNINGFKLNINGSLNASSLTGNGANITNVPYSTITGKPSYFPTDWNTTIANKPSIYTQAETNNLLNAKEAILTFSAPLTRNTNTIAINLNNYATYTALGLSNFVNFPQLSSCNYITNATSGLNNYPSYSALGLSNFVKFPQLLSCNYTNFPQLLSCNFVNFPQLSSCNYITNATSGLNNYPSYSALNASNYVPFTSLSSCNYITNATSGLNNYPSYSAIGLSNYANYTQLNSCNYITNSTTGLNNYPSYSAIGLSNYANYTQLNSCNYITNSTTGLTNYTRTGLDPAYLLKTGGVMSGQITGVSTLSATTGLFGKVATNNNTNVALPSLGVQGGLGDKIILYEGTASIYPYSLGINASTLFYSVPTGASHKFYCGGGNPKMTILSNGNIGIGIETPGELLYLYASAGNNAIQSIDSSAGSGLAILRLIAGNATTNRGTFLDFYNNFASTSVPRWRIVNNFDYDTKNDLRIVNASSTATLTILQNGNIGIGTNNPICKLDVAGIGCIHNGTPYAPANNFMRPGSLTIGGMSSNFGGGNNWSANTAGFLMECLDNTEIAVHDAGNRLASLMYYQGGVSSSTITIGRDMGWNAITNVNILGTLTSLNTTINGVLKLKNDVWHTSIDGINRLYYSANERSYYCCGANSTIGHLFMNSVYSEVFSIYNNGNVSIGGIDPTSFKLAVNGAIRMSSFDIVNSDGSVSHFQFSNGANYIRGRLIMDRAADTVSISANVGIGGAPTNYKLEVYGSVYVRGSIGIENENLNVYRSAGGIGGNINAGGNITCLLYAISNSGTDYVGVGNVADNNQNYLRQLYIMYGTFTGFHRCFTNDELFDINNPQSFKDNYIGRIVISTGKIATDLKSIENDEWEIKYDKDGITIEDALPMIELSRKKKDKRVYGVMGSSKRGNSRAERLIINSVGEGGMFVINSNGNIENGDYIQSSDYLGYGERQDDDILHNYSVAKASMDCNFELDSPLYNCFEIVDLSSTPEGNENGEKLRIAFIAVSYHCG